MASWVASSKVSFTSVWPYSPALILSSAVQNQPGKPWLPITCVEIGGSAAVTRSSLSEGPTLGNGGENPLGGPRDLDTGRGRTRPCAGPPRPRLPELCRHRRSWARGMIRVSFMQVRFWGTRGSIAAPGPKTARYGGNTSCVEVRASDGTVIILDCGTGARELGLHLAQTMPQPMRLHLFIGHTHWDHIQGFPFFVPAFLPGSELNIYAPIGFQRGLEEAMAGQMEYSYFPVKMRDLRSRIHFTELDEGFFRVGDVLVETQFMNHTAPTVAYRMTSDGATIVYATDHEPFWNASGRVSQHPGDERHIAFLKGANLVIHDAQYTEEEYRDKVGWGHSSLEYAVDVALAAGVERLVLFHHDPAHDDAILEQMETAARAQVARRGQALDVLAAREGLELRVRGSGAAPDVAEASALQHRQIAGGRVLVISANENEIEEILGEDGLQFLRQSDMNAALARGAELLPDIAIIDREALDGDAGLAALRERLGRRNLPIIVLADSTIPSDAVYRGEASSTDYLAKPFSPPMLRARVRAWLAPTLMVFDPAERAAGNQEPP